MSDMPECYRKEVQRMIDEALKPFKIIEEQRFTMTFNEEFPGYSVDNQSGKKAGNEEQDQDFPGPAGESQFAE